MSLGKVLVYGGKGALGATCVSHFKSKKWWVGSIDLASNDNADVSIVVPQTDSVVEQETELVNKVGEVLNGEKLDAIICVAGGWAGGNASKDLAKNAELMWRQSVCSSLISASIGSRHLKSGGLIVLTGAQAALNGTPNMIGYGMAKAAVHHLTKSLSENSSGLPDGSLVVSVLPVTLDTPMNRKWMSAGDFGSWTPLKFVAELFYEWANKNERPKNGSLIQLITKDSATRLVPAE